MRQHSDYPRAVEPLSNDEYKLPADITEVITNAGSAPTHIEANIGRKLSGSIISWVISAWHIA